MATLVIRGKKKESLDDRYCNDCRFRQPFAVSKGDFVLPSGKRLTRRDYCESIL